MTDRPILFSSSMVRAILDNRKTQTRRIIKDAAWIMDDCDAGYDGQAIGVPPYIDKGRCPYGQPGDRLWVRESGYMDRSEQRFFAYSASPGTFKEATTGGVDERCKMDAINAKTLPGWRSVPSIHMPRWASRITLGITGIHVERLQEISEEDAESEGAGFEYCEILSCSGSYKGGYANLWERINGPGAWDANPWVWVVEFERVAQEATK